MSENTNPEEGGIYATGDVINAVSANTKTIYIDTTNPTIEYNGEVWIDSSENPPILKNYNSAETIWQTHPGIESKAITMERTPDEYTIPSNSGHIVVQHNSVLDETIIHIKANGRYWGMK